ncbi:extracellular solute-binding protein [Streptococcus hillyeri]|uniref:Maltodextrin-binding protein n=1 Tax=Streptococcus hillyeri TaxID=2282420 RepID=A0A3L9DMD6_9STRE|nr:extracellular solute-binding protein [Streptococcus hillyeri]RLY01864.1 extracellular solute-binding protein [Streptococcus hillyeri]
MEWNWKKFAFGAVTLTSAVTLAACGNGSSNKSADSGEDSKKLVVSVDTGYVDYIKSIEADFEKENGVDIEVKEEGMIDTLDKLSTDGPTGAAPDVFIAPYDRVGGLGADGQIAEVKLGNEAEYDETAKKLVTLEGKVYGAPAVVESLILYYNKDLIKEAPKTFDELMALQKDAKYAFAGEEGKAVGFLANWTNFYYAYGLTAGYGGYVFGKDGTDASDLGLANKGAVEGLTYAKSWYDTWPQGMQDTTKAGDFITEQFTTGKTAAIIDGPWAATSLTEAGVKWGAAQIPALANGGKYEAFGGGKAWVVSSYSKNMKVAQKFLDYVTNEANQSAFYDATQEIPANVKAREYATSKGNELTSAVIAQFADAQPMPNIPQMAEVWEPAATLFFDVASGNKKPEEAAKEAVSTIKEAIEQKYSE